MKNFNDQGKELTLEEKIKLRKAKRHEYYLNTPASKKAERLPYYRDYYLANKEKINKQRHDRRIKLKLCQTNTAPLAVKAR